MKKRIILSTLLVMATLVSGATLTFAGSASDEAKAKCAVALLAIGSKYNLELDYADVDTVSRGDMNKYTGTRKGKPSKYVYVAYGLDDSADLDLYIAKTNGDVIAKDTDSSNVAVVQYQHAKTGKYISAVTADKGSTEYCYGQFRK